MSEQYSDEVKRAALDLLERDKCLDDSIFTPPGAIGFGLGGPEATSVPAEPKDKPPFTPGSLALELPIES